MMRIALAFRVFFSILFDSALAARVADLLAGGAVPVPDSIPAAKAATSTKTVAPPAISKPATPARSEALTLLATLQREARLIDLVQESLDAYSDAQIGAAARNVLRDSSKVLERLFALRPVVGGAEDELVDVPVGFDSQRWHVTGKVSGEPPFRGRLAHAGWQATQLQLPTWTGSADSAQVIAPAEVEV
jgi:hypothetical protein